MTFDKWYEGQSRLLKIILLLIPFVGWIVEILVRVSACLRKGTTVNLLGLIVFVLFGLILAYVDLFCLIFTGKLALVE